MQYGDWKPLLLRNHGTTRTRMTNGHRPAMQSGTAKLSRSTADCWLDGPAWFVAYAIVAFILGVGYAPISH